MATDGMASWIDLTDPKYAAADLRRLDSLLMAPGGPTSAPFAVKAGHRVNGAGLQVSVGGSPEAWTCTPGPGMVYNPDYSTQGGWRFEIPNAKSGTIGARPSSGQSRIDLIVARIYDNGAIGSGPSEVKIERLVGSPGQDPQPPTPPQDSITYEVARMTVPATGPVVVTSSTERTVAAGGVLPVPTVAAMNKLKTTGIAYTGMVVNNAQADRLERFNGTDWKPVPDDRDACMGLFWGAFYDVALHDHKTFSFFAQANTSEGANIEVVNLNDHFVGVTGVSATPANGDVVSGANVVRTLVPFLVGSVLYLRAENSAGQAMLNTAVRFSVVLHGWI